MKGLQWRNARLRCKLGPVDGTVLFPLFLSMVFASWWFLAATLLYSGFNVYLNLKHLSIYWLLRRAQFRLRGARLWARPPSYWRYQRSLQRAPE